MNLLILLAGELVTSHLVCKCSPVLGLPAGFFIWEGVVVVNELISITYYFGRVRWSLKS